MIFNLKVVEAFQLFLEAPARPVESIKTEALTLECADVSANLIKHTPIHAILNKEFEIFLIALAHDSGLSQDGLSHFVDLVVNCVAALFV